VSVASTGIIGRSAGVDGVDDLGAVDPLQVDRGDAEGRVSELALDDDQWDALAGHLDGVRVAELMWREAAAYAGSNGRVAELRARRPLTTRARASALGHAEQRADGSSMRALSQG
jgi:hypothetical protein